MNRQVEIYQWKEQVIDKDTGYALTQKEVDALTKEAKESKLLYEYAGVWTKKYIDSDQYSVPWFSNESCRDVGLDNRFWTVKKAQL